MMRVKYELHRAGLPVYVASPHAGENFAIEVIHGLGGAFAVVPIVSDDYGTRTGAGYETYEELRFSYEKKTPMIPLRISKTWPPQPECGDPMAQMLTDRVFCPSLAYFDDRELQRPEEFAKFIRTTYLDLLRKDYRF